MHTMSLSLSIYICKTYIYIVVYRSGVIWAIATLSPNYTTSGKYFDNRASPPNVSEPFL